MGGAQPWPRVHPGIKYLLTYLPGILRGVRAAAAAGWQVALVAAKYGF